MKELLRPLVGKPGVCPPLLGKNRRLVKDAPVEFEK
jgi:hypothetical protein